VSPKSVRGVDWDAYIAVLVANLAALWAHRRHARCGRENLRAYIAKTRTIDKWCRELKATATAGGATDVRVAIGAAPFSHTGAGEVSAPTTYAFRRVCVVFGARAVLPVDEYGTTKCCAACGAGGSTTVLQDVYDDAQRVAGQPWRAVRGLKRCDSSDCCNYYDRDHNAALNILAVYVALVGGLPRPAHLSRTNPAVHVAKGRCTLRHG